MQSGLLCSSYTLDLLQTVFLHEGLEYTKYTLGWSMALDVLGSKITSQLCSL